MEILRFVGVRLLRLKEICSLCYPSPVEKIGRIGPRRKKCVLVVDNSYTLCYTTLMSKNKLLSNYIDDMNRWRKFRGEGLIDMDNIGSYVEDIFDSLLSNLSPENIHSDGEASRSEVNARYRYLTAVYEDLKELGFDHTDMKYYL